MHSNPISLKQESCTYSIGGLALIKGLVLFLQAKTKTQLYAESLLFTRKLWQLCSRCAKLSKTLCHQVIFILISPSKYV